MTGSGYSRIPARIFRLCRFNLRGLLIFVIIAAPPTAWLMKVTYAYLHNKPAAASRKHYVTCEAVLTDYEESFPWFLNAGKLHIDGDSPRAVFSILKPQKYAHRKIGIYFPSDIPDSPSPSEKGNLFSFQLPMDFLAGDFESIADYYVVNLSPYSSN